MDQKINNNYQMKEWKRPWEATQADPHSISSLNGIRYTSASTTPLHCERHEGWDLVLVSFVSSVPSIGLNSHWLTSVEKP